MLRSSLSVVAGSSVLLMQLVVQPALAAEPDVRPDRGAPYSIMIYGGRGTDTNFTQTVYAPWSIEPNDLGFIGIAAATRFGTLNDLAHALGSDLGAIGDVFTLEGEVGGGYRFGEESMAEGWAALFLRYDGLPWNDVVYTTIAADLGVSVLSEKSADRMGSRGGFGGPRRERVLRSPLLLSGDHDRRSGQQGSGAGAQASSPLGNIRPHGRHHQRLDDHHHRYPGTVFVASGGGQSSCALKIR